MKFTHRVSQCSQVHHCVHSPCLQEMQSDATGTFTSRMNLNGWVAMW